MSSHHFVKEGQESQLIVAGSPDYLDSEVLKDLLEWSPEVIAQESLAEWLAMQQLHCDETFDLKAGTIQNGFSQLIALVNVLINERNIPGITVYIGMQSKVFFPNIHEFNKLLGEIDVKFICGTDIAIGISEFPLKLWLNRGECFHFSTMPEKVLGQVEKEKGSSGYKSLNDGLIEIINNKPMWLIRNY